MKFQRPPGPPPKWWGLPYLRAQQHNYLGSLEQLHAQFGGICLTQLGHEAVYDLFEPDWVHQVLVDQSPCFQRWERAVAIFSRSQGTSSLQVVEGPTWQRLRRILQPGFSPKRLAGYTELMAKAASRALDALPVDAADGVDIDQAMTWLTMDVILRTLFSSEVREEARLADQAVRCVFEAGMRELLQPLSLPAWFPQRGQRAPQNARLALDELVWRHIQARRNALAQGRPHRDDLLSMMMQARDHTSGEQLTDHEIRDQCMAIFLAGHVTVAAALSWWAWTMAANPACAQRATAEVDQVVGRWRPGYADLPQLTYLNCCIQETLRLYPPAPSLFLRRARRDVPLGPWCLPKGALVRITPWVIHRDPRWFPEPARFDPERFTAEAQAQRPPCSYLPFGGGGRTCLGRDFALAELSLVTAMVLQRFELSALPGQPAPEPAVHITLRPPEGLRLRMRLRLHTSTYNQSPPLQARA
jgi:cytochrome P450